jgi:acetyl-CoA carboxylase biotin carboxyl carrier protein
MDLKELKKLISLMNENGLVEIEISEEGRRCVLKKSPPPRHDAHDSSHLQVAPGHQNHAAPTAVNAGGANAGRPAPAPRPGMEGTVTFNSPIVGTFYRSSTPGAEPFVKPGDRINAETVLCLIEAMKVFNEIKAEMAGTIVEVLVENQEAVEFNQPLFLIKP